MDNPDTELAGLIRTLAATQARILELTGGETDAVLGSTGEAHLLPPAQDRLRRSEAAQRQFAARQAAILDALPANIALLDADGSVVVANGAWRGFAADNGMPGPDAGIGLRSAEVGELLGGSDPEVATRVAQAIHSVVTGTQAGCTLEYPRGGPGPGHWFRLKVTPLDPVGAGGAVVTHADITEAHSAVEALRQSEQQFRSLFNDALAGIAVVDESGRFLETNPALQRLLGYREQALRGLRMRDVTHPDDRERSDALARDVLAGAGGSDGVEKRYLSADGEVVWTLASLSRQGGDPSRPVRIVEFSQDITELKRLEARLAESEERFRYVAGVMVQAVWDWDIVNDTIWWNDGYATVFGLDNRGADALARWSERIHPEDRDSVLQRLDELVHGGTDRWQQRFRIRHADGRIRTVEEHACIVRDPSGRALRMVGGTEDVTDRIQLEERLRQSQRLESVGQLTGGIAHDFNNLLTVILGNTEMLEHQLGNDTASTEMVRMIDAAARRAADLTRRLLAYARRQTLDSRNVDVSELVTGMEVLLRRTLGANIEMKWCFDPGLAPVLIDAGQLENALLNLALNARDAMPNGGGLTIEARNVRLDAGSAGRYPQLAPGAYVAISVSDTGVGIAAEQLNRVFEPFYTTKDPDKGTGLGLSMVHGFVHQSGGHVEIESEPGNGTTVRMLLPVGSAPATTVVSRESGGVSGGSETILLVEDDPLVRRFAREQLRRLGYRVAEATNGRQALEILGTDRRIDLLFTDMIMPGGISGRELADSARQRIPGLSVLYTSGYSQDGTVESTGLEPAPHVLAKPYGRADLARKVREALDSP